MHRLYRAEVGTSFTFLPAYWSQASLEACKSSCLGIASQTSTSAWAPRVPARTRTVARIVRFIQGSVEPSGRGPYGSQAIPAWFTVARFPMQRFLKRALRAYQVEPEGAHGRSRIVQPTGGRDGTEPRSFPDGGFPGRGTAGRACKPHPHRSAGPAGVGRSNDESMRRLA